MGGVQVSNQPSLERLKALDSLPNLPSQLAQANRLCTHSARADMIAKWLLENMKSTQQTRTNLEAWRSLHSAVRLLSPERLAMLLSSHNFTKTLWSTLEETQSHETLLETLADLVNLLLEVSGSSNGASLRAVLSVPAAQAAPLMGIWLQGVLHKAKAIQHKAQYETVHSLLHPILQIWALRKSSADENYLFAKHCLVPASMLLSLVSSEGQVIATKRKRCDGSTYSRYSSAKSVETLLARHVFLPARTTFYKTQNSAANTRHGEAGSQHPALTIEGMLEPLKNACVQTDDGGQANLSTLPLLLDISLRCVATPTPRQRTKERPWTEAVFQTLHACNMNHAGEIMSAQGLIEMLNVVGSRAALSKETLEMIVRMYCVPTLSPSEVGTSGLCTSERWQLTAQVIELGADLFTDPKIAEPLFDWITRSNVEGYESAANESFDPRQDNGFGDSTREWPIFHLEKIIVPILNAFGRSRNLPTFVEIWSKQLQHEAQDETRSIWSRLDEPFGSIVEDSLATDQIVELFDRVSKTITDTSPEESVEEATHSTSNIGPYIVILNGMLRDLHDESLLNSIVPKCEQLLVHVFERFHEPTDAHGLNSRSIAQENRIWALIRNVFELWFPPWAAAQSSTVLIAEKCGWLISRAAIKTALATANTMRPSNGDVAAWIREPRDAELFVATLCHHVAAYKDDLEPQMQDLFEQILDSLFQQLDPNHSQAISVYPTLMLYVRNEEARSDFLTRVIKAAATTSNGQLVAASVTAGLRSLVIALMTNIRKDVMDDLIRLAVGFFDSIQTDDEGDYNRISNHLEVIFIGVLSDIPVALLTRAQREKILDALTSTKRIKTYSDQERLRRRVALMTRLMETPNATSQLATDHATIWRVALGDDLVEFVDAGMSIGSQTVEPKTLTLMEELSRLVVKHLLTTQDQEKSISSLLQLSEDVKVVLNFVCDAADISGKTVVLSLSKAIMQGLERGSKGNLKQQFPHRSSQLLRAFCDRLLGSISEIISMIMDVESQPPASVTMIELNAIVDTLAVATEVFIEAADGQTSDLIRNVANINLGLLDVLSKVDTLQNAEPIAYYATLVRSFEVCCKYVSSGDNWPFAVAALRLLDIQAPPSAIEAVITSFEVRLSKLEGPAVASLIEQLLPLERPTQRSDLLLLQSCLTRLDRVDVTNAAGSVQYRLLPRLLHILVESGDLLIHQRATSCVLLGLREKPFLINQHTVDAALASLPKLLADRLLDSVAYFSGCQIMSALLLNHRARLQGRFHLVNSVYKTLITKLFRNLNAPLPNRALGKELGPKHARAFARALILYCEPPMVRRQTNASGLTDESRKEQAHVGQFVHDVLHHYCSQVLNGSLGEGMKEALTPGLWAMVEAIEMNDADGMKSLSAAMNNSERAVLRGIYDDWRRFGRWRGG